MIRIEVLTGGAASKVVESAEDLVRIGRSDESEVSLPEVHVSAEHASIVFTGEAYVVRDHQSTNGTRVVREGHTLSLDSQPSREMRLQSGDILELGDAEQPVRLRVSLKEDEDGTHIVSLRSVAELHRIEEAVGADRELLQGLYEAQRSISGAVEIDSVIDGVARQVFRFVGGATHVSVALREDEDPSSTKAARYVPMGTRTRDVEGRHDPIPITRSVFRKVVADRSAVLAADARQEVGETASLMAAQILSTIGVPLWQGEHILGVLQVDNRASSGVFRERDLDIVAMLAQTASQAFSNARLVQRLKMSEERQRNENVYLKRRESRKFEGIVGESGAMKRLFEQLKKVVDTRVTVLVEGETGTGKELVASAVHYWSNRAEKLFVVQNCAAVPENLLESELFGHRKGSFTGATDDKKGLFELADGGTLFLDEIGELPLSLQPKLLRVLQEGEVRAVGSNVTKRVDVRIVAATNRDLEREVQEGRFREDLFYRLGVFPIRIPPLRERREDIPLLAGHFLERYTNEFGKSIAGFSQQAMELLQTHHWPGNVRELQNEVQRVVIQVDDEQFVQPEHLSSRMRDVENVLERAQPTRGTLREMLEQVEKWILIDSLRAHNNNKSATAKTLGITREGLHKKLKNYGLA